MDETQSENAIPDEAPFALFDAWFAEAKAREPNDPEAVALATATANGSGALSWLSVNASAGTHVYTLYDPAEHVRVLATGGVAVSELTVRVL